METVLREYAAAIHAPVSLPLYVLLQSSPCCAPLSVRCPKPATSDANRKDVKGGALLFAVIGAKLSEGLNFTDELARAVVLVGLPFANLASPELRERMAYAKRHSSARAGAKDAGAELYENMCMNAVNQSIGASGHLASVTDMAFSLVIVRFVLPTGRAIRHKGDWAVLVLVDMRYAAPRIRSKLPKWIGQDAVVAEGFGQAMRDMGKFYREHKDA